MLVVLGKLIVGILYIGCLFVLMEIEFYFFSLLFVWYFGMMGGIGIVNFFVGKVVLSV